MKPGIINLIRFIVYSIQLKVAWHLVCWEQGINPREIGPVLVDSPSRLRLTGAYNRYVSTLDLEYK